MSTNRASPLHQKIGKRQFTPSDEKLQHLITTSSTLLIDVFLNRQEPS